MTRLAFVGDTLMAQYAETKYITQNLEVVKDLARRSGIRSAGGQGHKRKFTQWTIYCWRDPAPNFIRLLCGAAYAQYQPCRKIQHSPTNPIANAAILLIEWTITVAKNA